MKYKKLLCIGLICLGLAGSFAVGTKFSIANEEYVSIPNDNFKQEILSTLGGSDDFSADDEFNLQNLHYVSKSLLNNGDFGLSGFGAPDYNNPGNTSLEGIQYLNSEYLRIESPMLDLVPLKDLKNVKNLTLTDKFDSLGYAHGLRDLSVLKNLENLEYIDYSNLTFSSVTLEEKIPLLDISALNNLQNLKHITIQTSGSLPPVRLTTEDNNYEMRLPIVLSDRFTVSNSDWDAFEAGPYFVEETLSSEEQESMTEEEYEAYNNRDRMFDKLRWENIEPGTKEIKIWLQIQPPGMYYIADLRIPIIWEQ